MKNYKEYSIFDSVTPKAVTSSTDATPIVVTKAGHGFATGDLVLIFGHATNIAANGIFKITVLSSSTFSLQDRYDNTDIVGSGAGAGSGGVVMPAPKILLVEDFDSCILELHTSNSASLTLKIAGSLGKTIADASLKNGDTPNFGATQSDTNPYTYPALINHEDGSQVEGDTGIVLAGTDVHTQYEVNVNALKYLTSFVTAWTAGAITLKAILFNKN